MLIIIFLLMIFKKVSPYLITEKVFSQQQRSIKLDFYSYNSYNSNNFAYSYAFNSGCSYNSYSFFNSFNSFNSFSFYKAKSNKFFTQASLPYVKSTMSYSFTHNIWSSTIPATLMPTTPATLTPTTPATLTPTTPATLTPTTPATLTPTIPATLMPTIPATLMPTQAPVSSTLTFETAMTLSGFTQPVIDNNSLNAIILSIAKSANISSNYVFIKEYSFVNGRRKLTIFNIQNLYNLFLVSQFNIPITNSIVNPSSLYTNVASSLQTSISSGAFVSYLLTLNTSISSMNLTISNYTISHMNIVYNVPTTAPTIVMDGSIVDELGAIVVVKIVFITMAVFIGFLFIFMQILKRVNGYNKNIVMNENNSENQIHISI